MARSESTAAHTVRGCAHPHRCGSDGETCCHSDCVFSRRAYESLRDSSPPGGPAWRMWNEKAKAARAR